VRADAARNLAPVLSTGARMLADDPSASIAAIATEAGWTGGPDEGFLRPGLPARWAGSVLGRLVHLTAQEMLELTAAQAADLLVDTFLHGFGASVV
jgi:hypothetical protein